MPDYKAAIIVVLLILSVYNALSTGISLLWQVLFAMLLFGVLDVIAIKIRTKKYIFPAGAIISAQIIALLVNPGDYRTTSYVILVTFVIKQLLKPAYRNIFNPAVLGIVVSSLFLPVFSSWWGATGIITFILGLFLVLYIKRYQHALAFFIGYHVLQFGYQYFTGVPIHFSLGMLSGPLVFFAFFMVIEPVTSPLTSSGRINFGLGVAVLAFVLSFYPWFMANSFFLYLPLLFMNLMTRVLPKGVLG